MHDYVRLWNAVALELNRRDHTGKMNAKNQRGPTRSSRALAMVHIAMHDAFFGRSGALPTSTLAGLAGPINRFTAPGGVSAPAATADNEGPAVSAAARAVLLHLYPDFKPLIEETWQGLKFSPSDPAVVFGEDTGNIVINDRANDGSDDGGGVPPINGYWRHREDPTDLGQGLLGQRWGTVRFFSASALLPLAAHPVPRSNAYNRAHDQVRAKGSKILETGTPGAGFNPRTPLQTLIGLYWAYDGASQIGTPPRMYNQIARVILEPVTGSDCRAASARLLALINVAMADAGIAAWYYKYAYQLWRPVIGIREYDDSFWQGGSAHSHALHVRCDPWWTPLGAPRTNEPGRRAFTPPFPAYPSGHATFGAAAFEAIRLFFGFGVNQPDTLTFKFVSDESDGRAIAEDGAFRALHRRQYNSMLQAMFDNAVSRVYLGVHWRFDGLSNAVQKPQDILTDTSNIGGVPLGRKLAQDIFDNGMSRSNAQEAEIDLIELPPV